MHKYDDSLIYVTYCVNRKDR